MEVEFTIIAKDDMELLRHIVIIHAIIMIIFAVLLIVIIAVYPSCILVNCLRPTSDAAPACNAEHGWDPVNDGVEYETMTRESGNVLV